MCGCYMGRVGFHELCNFRASYGIDFCNFYLGKIQGTTWCWVMLMSAGYSNFINLSSPVSLSKCSNWQSAMLLG